MFVPVNRLPPIHDITTDSIDPPKFEVLSRLRVGSGTNTAVYAGLYSAEQQRETVTYLLAHGANPRRALPHDPAQTVLSFARQLRTPLLATLEAPLPARSARVAASTTPATGAALISSGITAR